MRRLLAAVALLWAGCYSFTGASVPPHLRTVAVPLVEDQSGFGEPGLRELFTRELTEQFRADNSLQLAERTTADAVVEGTIMSVVDAPAVVAAGETVTRRRITVNAVMRFQDMKLRRKVWEKTFSNYGDYESGSGLSRRDDGLRLAVRKIAEDVLLETVSGW